MINIRLNAQSLIAQSRAVSEIKRKQTNFNLNFIHSSANELDLELS